MTDYKVKTDEQKEIEAEIIIARLIEELLNNPLYD